jgi:hypothetical protein
VERLIVCQGTAQLVTAIAALLQHKAAGGHSGDSPQSRDHLLICGLAISQSQSEAFSGMIERMAALLHPFATISRLSDPSLEILIGKAQRATTATQIATLLEQATGIVGVDEVFTVRDWQHCNILALSAFPDATHVCYGDSVGVYLPRNFMRGRPSISSHVARLMRRLRSSRSALLPDPRIDISYLLLPGAFGMPPCGEVVRTKAAPLRNLFAQLDPLLDGVALDELRRRVAGQHLWVLMGSNFSEQGMMTVEAEISAYRDWISGLRPDLGTVLLIKSHPRDRTGKRELLEKELRGLFSEVISADSVSSAYLPMEALLLKLKPVVASMQCLTVSTACLGTHFVTECKTHIGFGNDLVTNYVARSRRHERSRHESDLRRLCGV